MMRTMEKFILRCEQLAREKGQRMVVAEIDKDEGRVIRIYPEYYANSDEFEAFCGEVLYVSENGGQGDDTV